MIISSPVPYLIPAAFGSIILALVIAAWEYAIELTPGSQIIKRYIDGATLRQQEFLFACRYFYGPDIVQNLTNSGFFDELSNWIECNSGAGTLPVLDKGREGRKMEALTCGYLLSEDGQTARYQIQCRFMYYKEA